VLVALFCCAAGCKKANQRTAPDLVSFTACSDLERRLKDNLRQEMRASLLSYNDAMLYAPETGGIPPNGTGSDSAFDGSKGPAEGVDYSGTNNQEPGVDEADFTKTDGYSIFVLDNNSFMMLAVPAFGSVDEGTSIRIEGSAQEMLIHKESPGGKADMAVVFSALYPYALPATHPLYPFIGTAAGSTVKDSSPLYRTSVLTKITVLDLQGTGAPQVRREFYVEGAYQTARLIESFVHMAASAWMDVPGLVYWPDLPEIYYAISNQAARRLIWNQAAARAIAANDAVINGLTLQDLVPRYYELSGSALTQHDSEAESCGNFSIAQDGVGRGYTSILSLDLLAHNIQLDDEHIVSNWTTVYASDDTMLLAEPSNASWWYTANSEFEEATNIHKFILDNATARYAGSGRVDGTVGSQFCLSEYDGAVRVAATTNAWGRWWSQTPVEPENHVYVLTPADNGSLGITGHLGGIAQGERIWAARFIGTKGYLVTFRNIDPLWTIDLSRPSAPAVIGEIQVPGVSTYIHPISEDRLLTIGYGGDENGLDWSIMVALFDVADFSNPVMIDNMTLFVNQSDNGSSTWGSSEAAYEHKAFQYWAPEQMLAVPLSASTSSWDFSGNGSYSYISRLMLIKVDPAAGFTLHGTIDHSKYFNSNPDCYWTNQDIRRSIFMGDYIYALSDRAVTVNLIDNMTETDAAELTGTCYEDFVYRGFE
jgi:hypothetical protein